MALQPVVLDDLDWKGMVDAIRSRIPAASNGQWTLHAPVDPGITLLDLFAWQLEQRLYRMDQVPEALNRSLLAMAGTRPRPTCCASTVFQLLPDPANANTVIPRRAEFTLDGGTPPIVYSTRAPLTLLKLKKDGLRLWVGTQERTADMAAGRVFRLFPSDGTAAAVRIELALMEVPAPGGTNTWFSLWFNLRTAATIAPQWSPNAAPGAPPPATLAWLYRSTDGTLRPFSVDDGTTGLRRSGVVRLRIPGDWRPEVSGQTYAIHLRTDCASYSAPPRLVALEPNAVVARHARATQVHALTRDPREWLPLPGNLIRLDALPENEPEKDVPALESACVLCLKERDGLWHRWWPIASLHASGPSSRVFIVDRERAQLTFGDGLNGRLPVLAAAGADGCNIRLRYEVGGGSAGAVGRSPGPAADWQGPDGCTAYNLTESIGGSEAETIADARLRSAAQLSQLTRAVTGADFESIALATPGVAVRRAHAAIGRHSLQPCAAVQGAVTIFVVPDVPREDLDPDLIEDAFVPAPIPDPGLLTAVRAELEHARLVGSEVFVSAPRYRAVRLRAWLRGDPHDPVTLQRNLHERLQRFLDPLVGGDAGTGWGFGESVQASVMLREAQSAVGQAAQVTQVAIGLDGDEPSETCRTVVIGASDLVWLQELTLQLERSTVPTGGLR